MDLKKLEVSQFKGKIMEAVKAAEAVRSHKENPKDVSFEDNNGSIRSVSMS